MDDPTMRREPTEGYQCPICHGFHYHWQPPCDPQAQSKEQWCADCGSVTHHEVWGKKRSHFERCTICGKTYEQVGINYVRRIA
jgi:hypothetical protein